MRLRAAIMLCSFTALAAACGGGGDAVAPAEDEVRPGAGTTVTGVAASINGTPWRSLTAQSERNGHGGMHLHFSGRDSTTRISVAVTGVTGPGTYSVQNSGVSFAHIIEFGRHWTSSHPGGSGTVTVTALTTTRVAGTFSFVAVPDPGTPGGTRHVTNGQFDIAF
jgi:hypothetical protein